MVVGYSLSPGGLLFPYHVGTLAALSHHKYLTDDNPIAGSSAGSIAVVCHSAGIKPEKALDLTVRMSDDASALGGVRGNLLPLLKNELQRSLENDVHEQLNERSGFTGVAYLELYPKFRRSQLQTFYESKMDVINAVCDSCAFPFFSHNLPFRWSKGSSIDGSSNGGGGGRIAMDGYFAVPRDRFGCPDLNMQTNEIVRKNDFKNGGDDDDDVVTTGRRQRAYAKEQSVDRTITISVLPHDYISLTASEPFDRISPSITDVNELSSSSTLSKSEQIPRLLRLATMAGTREDYYSLYEDGWADAERWMRKEEEKKMVSG